MEVRQLFMQVSKLALLLGAGASFEAGIPMMPEMGRRFLDECALQGLRDDLVTFGRELAVHEPAEWGGRHNVEVLLQYLAHTLAHDTSALRRRAAAILRFEAMKFILKCTSRHKEDLRYLDGLDDFVRQPEGLDVFSLNYDTVIEDWCQERDISYADGFAKDGRWAIERFHDVRCQLRLHKLHGSVTWALRNGVVRRGSPAGAWRTELQWGKLSSLTLEASIIYPATDKGPFGMLQVLLDLFRHALNQIHVLVVAGYRCADEHVLSILSEALAQNTALRVLICSPSAREVVARLRTRRGWQNFRNRIHPFAMGLGEALTQDLFGHAQRKLPGPAAEAAIPGAVPGLEAYPGQFRVVRGYKEDLVLACAGSVGTLVRLERGSGKLYEIRTGFGDLRDFMIAGDTAFVVDNRLDGKIEGLGGIWRVNLLTGRRRLLTRIPNIAILGGLARKMRERNFDALAVGVIGWPTSICGSAKPDEIFVLAARRVISITLHPLTFRDVTGDSFFNACAITFAGEHCLVVAEHVFGADISGDKGLGALWEVHPETGVRRLIKAGLQLGHGIAHRPARKTIIATEITGPGNWRLIEVQMKDGKIIRSAGTFCGKAAFTMLDDDTAIVSTEKAYGTFMQPLLIHAHLRPIKPGV
jgi:hypothetical protein